MVDKKEVEIENGSIIDIHQTVNGSRFFIILQIDPLDIRYAYDLMRPYEYDKKDLLAPCKLNGDIEFEVVGNVYEGINISLQKQKLNMETREENQTVQDIVDEHNICVDNLNYMY